MYSSTTSFSAIPTASVSTPTVVTSTTPHAAAAVPPQPPSAASPTVGNQQHSLTQQQIHQLSAAYAAAHQLPGTFCHGKALSCQDILTSFVFLQISGMLQTFTPTQQGQPQQQITNVSAQQQRWTASSQASIYQQQARTQQQPSNSSDAQQQQFLHTQQAQAQVGFFLMEESNIVYSTN